MSMVIITKDAKEKLMSHARYSAREIRKEVVGWFIGFCSGDRVYISYSVPCTRYRKQSMTEAEADPSEESEVADRYPRDIGIVGIYHTHPFVDRPRRHGINIFHSITDDMMLRSRASSWENYVSAVTDGMELKFYTIDRDARRSIEVEVKTAETIDHTEMMDEYTVSVNISVEKPINYDVSSVSRSILKDEVKALRELMHETMEENLKPEDCIIDGKSVSFGATDKRKRGTRLKISRTKDEIKLGLEINISTSVFVVNSEEDYIGLTASNEVTDDAEFLIVRTVESIDSFYDQYWNRISDGSIAELNIGEIVLKRDTSGLPRKELALPKRKVMVIRGESGRRP